MLLRMRKQSDLVGVSKDSMDVASLLLSSLCVAVAAIFLYRFVFSLYVM